MPLAHSRKSVTGFFLFSFLMLTAPYVAVSQSWAANALLNINTAQVAELAEQLPGIGPAKAVAIVKYREANGPFKTLDALTDVKGIGPATLAKIRGLLFIDKNLVQGKKRKAVKSNSHKKAQPNNNQSNNNASAKETVAMVSRSVNTEPDSLVVDNQVLKPMTLAEREKRTSLAVQAAINNAKRAEDRQMARESKQNRNFKGFWQFLFR